MPNQAHEEGSTNMSQLAEQIKKSSGLLDAVQAVTNRTAFLTLLITFVACGLFMAAIAGIAAALGGVPAAIMGAAGFLIAGLAGLTGISATGFAVNDKVRGRESEGIKSAFLRALSTIHRPLGVLLLVLIIEILLALIVGLLLLVCKTPFLGPVLYAVVFPLSVAVTGVILYVMLFVLALAGPAIWEGNTIMRTVALLWAITRNRLLSVVIQTLLLGLLVGLTTGLIFGPIGMGMGFTMGLSASILGAGTGYTLAAGFGMAVIVGCALVVPVLVLLAGYCIIYANATEDLSADDAENAIKGAISAAREKAEQAKRKLEEKKEKQEPATEASKASETPVSAAAACPQCQAAIGPDDAFCGSCGHQLK
jgi:hypothetical protein